jgi:ATP-dependent DNA ligase
VKTQKNEFEVVEAFPVASSREVMHKVDLACQDTGFEGVIIKRLDDTYQLNNVNRKFGWMKVKMDNVEGLNDTVDCVILGAAYGQGNRVCVFKKVTRLSIPTLFMLYYSII